MRRVEYLRTAPDWKKAQVAESLKSAKAEVAAARKEITRLKREYGITKRGYSIYISDLPLQNKMKGR